MSTTRVIDPAANLIKVTVSGGHTALATTVTLSTGEGAKLPDPATVGAYNTTWYNHKKYPDPSDDPNKEIVRITAKSSDSLTVTRGQESISATAKNTTGGVYKLLISLTKKMVDDINTALQKRQIAITVGTTGSGAMYICDGTDDDSQIQEALTAASTGKTYQLAGDYSLTGTVACNSANFQGEGKDKTKLIWAGSGTDTLLNINNTIRFSLEDMTIDGDSIAGITGVENTELLSQCHFKNVAFNNCAIGFYQGVSGKQLFDSGMYSCDFKGNAIGLKTTEFQLSLFSPVFENNTTGIDLQVNSNVQVFGGAFTGNETDIHLTGHPENCSFQSTWFEESTTGIFRCDVGAGFIKNLTFTACRFCSSSTDDLFDFTNISGQVVFIGCQVREVDTGGGVPSATNVVVGEYCTVTYVGCSKVDLVGAITEWTGS